MTSLLRVVRFLRTGGFAIGMTSAHFFNGRTDNGHSTVLAAVALALAGTIFYIDTFTNIEGAIAVLYVIALLLLGDILTPRGHGERRAHQSFGGNRTDSSDRRLARRT